jgi:nucleotide-binding universal stress UspA family protein
MRAHKKRSSSLVYDRGRPRLAVDATDEPQEERAMAHRVTPAPRVTGQLRREVGEDLRSLAEGMLAKVEQERGKPNTAPTSIELLNGPPAEIIEEFLRPPDLLVIGSRGIGGVRRLLLGSVSSALVQAAPCSVEVVKPEAGSDGGRPGGR